MKFRIFCFWVCALHFVTGCSHTLVEGAESVFVHKQVTNFLDDCEKVGQFVSSYNTLTKGTMNNSREVRVIAQNRAKQEFNADNIVILSEGFGNGYDYQAQILAYRCN
jgi:hypothetical protein